MQDAGPTQLLGIKLFAAKDVQRSDCTNVFEAYSGFAVRVDEHAGYLTRLIEY